MGYCESLSQRLTLNQLLKNMHLTANADGVVASERELRLVIHLKRLWNGHDGTNRVLQLFAYLPCDLVSPTGIVSETLNAVPNVVVPDENL